MDDTAHLSFGERVKQRRKSMDLTQQALAQAAGCTTAMIRKIEADLRQPSRQLAIKLAESFQLLPAEQDGFIRAARERSTQRSPLLHPGTFPGEQLTTVPNNLPAHLTPLIGRAAEVEAACHLLTHDNVRLLTLCGPPGVGKSRIGMQVAFDCLPAFPDGVYHVPLAVVDDPALVASVIACTIGVIGFTSGGGSWDELGLHLQDKRLLLLLDDGEHALTACPQLTGLLARCSQLKVLVSSRETLRLSGEHHFSVGPLAYPDLDTSPSFEELACAPAMILFVERARSVAPSFTLTPANAAAVASICAHLDGLPLAIELAAGRSTLFTPAELLAKLDHRFLLLADGPSDAPERQRTLKQAFNWSYDRLSITEQWLFAQMGIFVDGATLEAIATVGAELYEHHPSCSILDDLAALVRKSLVIRRELTAERARFHLLKTVREYAVHRLRDQYDELAVSRRHASYYLALARSFQTTAEPQPDQPLDEQLLTEYTNLLEAFGWLLRHGPLDDARWLGRLLNRIWHHTGQLTEGRTRLETLLATAPIGGDRSRAQLVAGLLATTTAPTH